MDASYRKLTSYFRDGCWGIYETSRRNISKSRQVGGYLTENRFATVRSHHGLVFLARYFEILLRSSLSRRSQRNLAEIAVKFLHGIASFGGAITFRTLS